jgi:hypothetical protein
MRDVMAKEPMVGSCDFPDATRSLETRFYQKFFTGKYPKILLEATPNSTGFT